MRAIILSAFLALSALAGCIGTDETDGTPSQPVIEDLFAGNPLWADPQNTPHPDWNWPTLSSPPNATHLPAFWAPINGTALPDVITGIEPFAASPAEVKSGAGIAIFGSIAFVPGFSEESYVVDISDPAAPQHLATVNPEAAHRGAAMIAYPDGRLAAVVSTSPGFDIVELTDPTAPEIIGSVTPSERGHKLGVVPGTPIVYNAGSAGGAANGIIGEGHYAPLAAQHTSIYDLTDPNDPQLVKEFDNGFACHHIYFWSDGDEKHRAVCAGIEYTQIWDIADPLDPKVIVDVPVHHGVAGTPSASVFLMAFSHFSILSQDGNTLIVGDEMGGGGVPPGCGAHASTPLADVSTPLGALWFYDVSDETNPVLKGWFSPGEHFTQHQASLTCTAHHGRIIPQEDRDLLAMAFYGAGVVLVDFTDPMLPTMVDQWNQDTDTWELWYNNGYLFTGDLGRGFEVFAFE